MKTITLSLVVALFLQSSAGVAGELPLSFQENRDQFPPQVRYFSITPAHRLFFVSNGVNMAFAGTAGDAHVIASRFVGASPDVRIEAEEQLPGVVNYAIGDDPARWQNNIPTFARVVYHDIYPGIDVAFYGRAGEMEDDYIIRPGAEVSTIEIEMQGVEAIEKMEDGSLKMISFSAEFEERPPVAYQETDGERSSVSAGFRVLSTNRFGLEVGEYDKTKDLVIDPRLIFSSYLGGSSGDQAYDVIVTSNGEAIIVGSTASANFPTNYAFQWANAGGYDAFVTKFAPNGSNLVFSTYLGGSGGDGAYAVAVDAEGMIYVAGGTTSANFPTASSYQGSPQGGGDAFVAQLTPSGQIYCATYLGSIRADRAEAVAATSRSNIWVFGYTETNFPNGVAGSYRGGASDTFLARLSFVDGAGGGMSLAYSTNFGGIDSDGGALSSEFSDMAMGVDGSIYVCGMTRSTNFPITPGAFRSRMATNEIAGPGECMPATTFVTKFPALGGSPIYSTFLGASAGYDVAHAIAVSTDGYVYVVGETRSTDFPVKNAYQGSIVPGGTADAFLTKFEKVATNIVYSTYLGGSGQDWPFGVDVDAEGNAYVVGMTQSTDFPTTNAVRASNSGGWDVFVTKFRAAGNTLDYSTYVGGNGSDAYPTIAVDGAGSAYVVGWTTSTNFPTTNAIRTALGGSDDGFIFKLPPIPAREPALSAPTISPSNTIDLTVDTQPGWNYTAETAEPPLTSWTPDPAFSGVRGNGSPLTYSSPMTQSISVIRFRAD